MVCHLQRADRQPQMNSYAGWICELYFLLLLCVGQLVQGRRALIAYFPRGYKHGRLFVISCKLLGVAV